MYVMLDMLCVVLSFFFGGKLLSKVCFCASSVQTWHLTWRTSDIFVRVLLNYFILQAINSYFRKVVGKSARDNPERYCGWFWVYCSSKNFERMSLKAMDECLRVLKESNKSRFDSYSVRNSVLITSHITFRDCRAHIFSDNLSRNSCIRRRELQLMETAAKRYTPTFLGAMLVSCKVEFPWSVDQPNLQGELSDAR